MKIASFDEPRPRGVVIGKQVTGPRLNEAEHFRKCPLCGGYFDKKPGLRPRFSFGSRDHQLVWTLPTALKSLAELYPESRRFLMCIS
jgi:hypothetical protein